MSIDYDRLRELREEATPGPWERHPEQPRALCNLETKFLVHHEMVKSRGMEPSAEDVANTELIALAPDMARELLRLHDGMGELVDSKRLAAELMSKRANTNWRYDAERYIADAVDEMCDNLTDLLNGDQE